MHDSLWRFLFVAGSTAGTNAGFHLFGFYGWLEGLCFGVLLLSGVLAAARIPLKLSRVPVRAWVLLAVAAATRMVVPHLPYNWYFGVWNLPISGEIFTRKVTYLPLPNRLVVFDMGLGFHGILCLNTLLGMASVLLLWNLARRIGLGERVAFLLGILLAVTPMYVRLSSSDAPHVMLLFLWILSAYAFSVVRDGRRGVVPHLVLFAATVMASPIRIESFLLMPSIPFFVARGPAAWRDIMVQWRRFIAYWSALAIGGTIAFVYHADTIVGIMDFQRWGWSIVFMPPAWLIFGFMRVLGAMNILMVQYLPVLIAFPITCHLVGCLRNRDFNQVLAYYGPPLMLTLPMIVEHPFIADLAESSYNIIYAIFLLTACAKGISYLYDLYQKGTFLGARWKRITAVALAPAMIWFFFVIPYEWTCVFQEEFSFLDKNLPNGQATVAVIFDPANGSNHFDCCLGHPYPPFLGSHPRIRWITLTERDLEPGRIEGLDFDYYYTGTLALLDSEKPVPSTLDRLAPESNNIEQQPYREHLRKIQRLDQLVRKSHTLSVAVTAKIPAKLMPPFARGTNDVNFGFPSAELEVTLFRHIR